MESKQERRIKLRKALAESYKERYAPEFSKIFQAYWNNEMLGELSEVVPEERILDLGCGPGVMFQVLASRFTSVFGLDLSFDMLQQVERDSTAKLVAGDAIRLPFRPGSLGAVVCRGALHHSPSAMQTLEEIYRVLKPGGSLVLSEPSNDSVLVAFARWVLYRWSWRFDKNDRGFKSSDLVGLLAKANFSILRLRRFGFLSYLFAGFPDVLGLLRYVPGSSSLTRLFMQIDRRLERNPFFKNQSFHIIVSTTKA